MSEQFFKSFFWFLASFLRTRRDLAVENIALRQQITILKDKNPRPKLKNSDRLFWVILCRFWKNWKSSLIIVRLETVIRWHRKGYKFYWTRKIKPCGRPRLDINIQKLIQQIAKENDWGVSRIHSELLKLGIEVSETTILRYLPKDLEPPKTMHPDKQWIKQHLRNAFPGDHKFKYLIRDNENTFDEWFDLKRLGIVLDSESIY